jgi:hypothetical protein
LRCTYEISHETMSFIAQKACIYRGLRGHWEATGIYQRRWTLLLISVSFIWEY